MDLHCKAKVQISWSVKNSSNLLKFLHVDWGILVFHDAFLSHRSEQIEKQISTTCFCA